MKRLSFAWVIGLVVVACGGAGTTDLFTSSGTSGTTGGTDGGSSSSGTDGGGGGGGSQKDSGTGGGGGGTDAGTPVDAGGGGGTGSCTIASDGVQTGCPTGEACITTNCKSGTCQKVNTNNTSYAPVCGCDAVNYWNAGVAGDAVAAIRTNGVCATPATCNGNAGSATCPALGSFAGAACAFERADNGVTCGAQKAAVCWGLPAGGCPKAMAGSQGVSICGGITCSDLCSAIDMQQSYRVTAPACTVP